MTEISPDIYKDGHTDIAHPIAKKWGEYRLSGEEWQVLWVIIEKTWGWHKSWNNISLKQFYEATKMKKPSIIRAIKKLIDKNIVSKKANKNLTSYHINSHFNTWKPLAKELTLAKELMTVSKRANDISKRANKKIQNSALENNLQDPKESFKRNKIVKNTSITHENEKQKISLKDEKQEKAKELIKQFCSLREIPLDSGFFSKNIRSARLLVGNYPVELILAGIVWRLKNDPDNFWTQKLWNLNSVYSHFAEWIAQSKLKTEKTFTDWLAQNSEQDYRSIEESDAKIKAFFVAFNRALKDGICPTSEEWAKYQLARDLNNKSLRR